MKIHNYKTRIVWTGNKGTGTSNYAAYSRDHVVSIENKVVLQGSADFAFRGDPTKHNPEDLLLSSLSACHMLWYLHLCADAGVIVTEYVDHATGTMKENYNGGGHFIEVILNPTVTVTEQSMIDKALALHEIAHQKCFIANSVNFPVLHNPTVKVG